MNFIRPITVHFYQSCPQRMGKEPDGQRMPNSNVDEYATIVDAKSLDELHQEWNQISIQPHTCCVLEDTDKILVRGRLDWDKLEQYFLSGGFSY